MESLLVDAEHQRLLGRIQVKTHHVADFFRQLGVIAEFEGSGTVRLDAPLPPNSLDGAVAGTDLSGQGPGAPMGGSLGGLGECCGNHLLDKVLAVGGWTPATGSLFKAFKPSRLEARTPLEDVGLRAAQPLGDHLVGQPIGGEQDDASAEDLSLGQHPTPGPELENLTLIGRDVERRRRR